jgi:hypothetical protein
MDRVSLNYATQTMDTNPIKTAIMVCSQLIQRKASEGRQKKEREWAFKLSTRSSRSEETKEHPCCPWTFLVFIVEQGIHLNLSW